MPVANSEFRIEKERVAVVVTTESGERLTGELFVQPFARHRVGREEAIDVLNEPEPYFPLSLGASGTVLVAKARVRDVELRDREAGETRLAMRPATVEVIVAGGEVFLGELRIEVSSERPRVLDFLNRIQERFVALHTADGIRLVNCRLIERVRPLD